ncbi:MAG: thioredoxin family protein [Ignavibacterium sp.]|nr:MAG: thioredoxin family protein [Ignavibacterium sp.]
MNITLFVTNRCAACDRVRRAVENMLNKRDGIKLHIEDIRKERSKGIIIVPALFIEDELYAYGDIDEGKFMERVETLSLIN